MSIWLIGSRGMLGTEVEKLLKEKGLPHLSTVIKVDITDLKSLRTFTSDRGNIDCIINCSGYTAVDKAEDEPETAFRINAGGTQNIVETAKSLNAALIHISTDYVFNGEKESAYLENDPADPIGVYGKSKLKGDQCIQSSMTNYYIIRTAWLFGKQGNNFVNTMLKLFEKREEVKVVSDQWGSPTYAPDLAEVILKVIENRDKHYGVYNFTNEGRTNWHAVAGEIYKLAREKGIIQNEVNIIPISTEEFPTRARRPRNSYLSKEKIKRNLGITIRSWQDALQEYISELEREA